MRKPDAVRAKFSIDCVSNFVGQKKIIGSTVYDSEPGENKDFTDATPCGQLELVVSGPAPAGTFFSPGEEFYADFRSEPVGSGDDVVEDIFTVSKIIDTGAEKEVHLKVKPLPHEYPDAHRDFSTDNIPYHRIEISIWKDFPAWLFFEVDKDVHVSFTKADQ